MEELALFELRYLSMVIGRDLRYWAGQLCDLDLLDEVPLEAGEDDLPLTRLEPIDERRDGPHIVHVAEQNEFSVDELVENHSLCVLAIQVQLAKNIK